MTYATPVETNLADDIGYSYDCNQQRGHVFKKGTRHVWSCSTDAQDRLLLAWQTADLIDGRYINHKKFTDLSEALNRPITVAE